MKKTSLAGFLLAALAGCAWTGPKPDPELEALIGAGKANSKQIEDVRQLITTKATLEAHREKTALLIKRQKDLAMRTFKASRDFQGKVPGGQLRRLKEAVRRSAEEIVLLNDRFEDVLPS